MKTIYAYVVADLLHYGHVRHLRRARGLGDFLICGVLTDMATRQKKPAPIQGGYARMEMIRALRYVNQVKWQHEYSPLGNVMALMPDIVAESEDHKGNEYLEELIQYVKSYGGKVVFLPYTDGVSTTKIKEKIVSESNRSACKKCGIHEGNHPEIPPAEYDFRNDLE